MRLFLILIWFKIDAQQEKQAHLGIQLRGGLQPGQCVQEHAGAADIQQDHADAAQVIRLDLSPPAQQEARQQEKQGKKDVAECDGKTDHGHPSMAPSIHRLP